MSTQDIPKTAEEILATTKPDKNQTPSQKADALEASLMDAMTPRPSKAFLYTLGEKDPSRPDPAAPKFGATPNTQRMLMGDDPRLQKMPERPTLMDFFHYRWGTSGSVMHLMQSANLARSSGLDEKIVLACLLHDIGVVGFLRSDHGYWGAQLIEPYVDEEVSWAIKMHQVLRFYPDESVGYEYPDRYLAWFGEDYKPEPYIAEEYERAKKHKWYTTARLITLNDLYSFDPSVVVQMEDFEDIIGRHFKQPKEGLGFDNSPVAHMWRTIIWPTRFL